MKKNIAQLCAFLIVATAMLSGCGGEASGGSDPNSGGGTSTAGSTSTMLNFKNALYVLEAYKLTIMDLDVTPPRVVGSPIRMRDAETLFIYNEHLYVGGLNSVRIYDVSDPFNPIEVSSYPHIMSCDPVIVSDGIGYVTLRALGRRCQNAGENRLEIVDFSDPKFPEYIAEYELPNPYGLAKTPDYLAICQEQFGLILLNVDDPEAVQTVQEYPDIHCFDLIYTQSRLIATASNGIFQFHASETALTELSKIPVGKATSLMQRH